MKIRLTDLRVLPMKEKSKVLDVNFPLDRATTVQLLFVVGAPLVDTLTGVRCIESDTESQEFYLCRRYKERQFNGCK